MNSTPVLFTRDWNHIHAFTFEQDKGINVMHIVYQFVNIWDVF
jgi:hypothetical protein